MNQATQFEFSSADTVLNTLLIGGMAVGCAVLAVAQNVSSLVA